MKWELTGLTQDGCPVLIHPRTGELVVETADQLVDVQAATLAAWAEARHAASFSFCSNSGHVGINATSR